MSQHLYVILDIRETVVVADSLESATKQANDATKEWSKLHKRSIQRVYSLSQLKEHDPNSAPVQPNNTKVSILPRIRAWLN